MGSMTPLEQLAFAEAMDEAREKILAVFDMLPKVDWGRYMDDEYDADDEEWEDAEEGEIEEQEDEEEAAANEDSAGFLEDVVELGWFA